jgi:hypothetical protein
VPTTQKCVHCPKPSVPGLKKGQGLCQNHWDLYAYGKPLPKPVCVHGDSLDVCRTCTDEG